MFISFTNTCHLNINIDRLTVCIKVLCKVMTGDDFIEKLRFLKSKICNFVVSGAYTLRLLVRGDNVD